MVPAPSSKVYEIYSNMKIFDAYSSNTIEDITFRLHSVHKALRTNSVSFWLIYKHLTSFQMNITELELISFQDGLFSFFTVLLDWQLSGRCSPPVAQVYFICLSSFVLLLSFAHSDHRNFKRREENALHVKQMNSGNIGERKYINQRDI